jgi:DNA-binding transcriptional LysR family regulator
MERLIDLLVFVRVVEKQSFTAAGKELRISTSAVSKHIARLEQSLSLKLLQRSTHNLKPTECGFVYYDHCIRILAGLREAQADAAAISGDIKGLLRVHSTPGTGLNLVAPATIDFARMYSSVTIELTIGHLPDDVTKDAIDVIVTSRHFSQLETPVYASLESRDIGPMPYVICASPGYFDTYGVPKTPTELTRHSCLIHLTHKKNPNEWFFHGKTGDYSVCVRETYRSNFESAVLMAAVEGLGIARLPEYTVSRELAAKSLKPIFRGTVRSGRMIKAFHARSKYMPRKVRAFLDLLEDRFGRSLTAA